MMKFIDDTLKVNGKYSLKRVLVAVSFPYMLLLGSYIVLSDKYLGTKVVNVYAIQVFQSMLAFIVSVVVTSAYAKKLELKNSKE
jgi:hypothetical protein